MKLGLNTFEISNIIRVTDYGASLKTNDDFLNQSYDFCQFCNIININFAKGDLFC